MATYQQYSDPVEPETLTPAIPPIPSPQLQNAQALQNTGAVAPVQPGAVTAVAMSTIVVPPGVVAGQRLDVIMPDGQLVSVTVPEGVYPGMQFHLQHQPRGQPQPQPPVSSTTSIQPAVPQGQQHRVDSASQNLQPQNVHTVPANPTIPPMPLANSREEQDRQASKVGWGLYTLGWLCCCFCPPISPCLWCAAALMHFCKPGEERANLRQQRRVAKCSAATVCLTTLCYILVGGVFMCIQFHHLKKECHEIGCRAPTPFELPKHHELGWHHHHGKHWDEHHDGKYFSHQGRWWHHHDDKFLHEFCVCPDSTTTADPTIQAVMLRKGENENEDQKGDRGNYHKQHTYEEDEDEEEDDEEEDSTFNIVI